MTITEFNQLFPSEEVCLEYLFKKRYPDLTGYYRIRTRKCFANAKGHQINPLVGTIFEKSTTPLLKWFYAIYLFSQSKHGVPAAELQRTLGITSKCAFRMGHQIRSLMKQSEGKLSGIVETDSTYIGATKKLGCWYKKHIPVTGVVERGGRVHAKVLKDHGEWQTLPYVRKYVRKGATLYTDGAMVYRKLTGYTRGVVYHGAKEYVRGDIHTNTIENFWSHLKRRVKSTYCGVSKQYLQNYVNETAFSWNYRANPFSELMGRL